MISAKWRAALVILVTFAIGVLAGIAAEKTILREPRTRPDPETASRHYADVLEDRLTLNPAQKTRVQAILLQHWKENEAIFRETQPRIRARMEKTVSEIQAVLNADQKAEYLEYLRERKERRRKR